MPKMSQILIKGQKVTRPPRFHEEHKLSSLKNLHIGEWLGDINSTLTSQIQENSGGNVLWDYHQSMPPLFPAGHYQSGIHILQMRPALHRINIETMSFIQILCFPLLTRHFFQWFPIFTMDATIKTEGRKREAYRVGHCWYRGSLHLMISQFMILANS